MRQRRRNLACIVCHKIEDVATHVLVEIHLTEDSEHCWSDPCVVYNIKVTGNDKLLIKAWDSWSKLFSSRISNGDYILVINC